LFPKFHSVLFRFFHFKILDLPLNIFTTKYLHSPTAQRNLIFSFDFHIAFLELKIGTPVATALESVCNNFGFFAPSVSELGQQPVWES